MFGRRKKPRIAGVPTTGIVTDETALLAVGLPGSAVITSAYDCRITVDDIDGRMDPASALYYDPVWTVNLRVTLAEREPFDVSMTLRVPKQAIPRLNAGTSCSVAADSEHPMRTVAIDWSRF